MPRFDKTGPMGLGPRTGRGLGPCGLGAGFWPGYGRGFGRFWRFGPEMTKREEKEILEDEAKALSEDLQAVKARLAELAGKK